MKKLFIPLFILSLAGCVQEEVQTIAWYLEHEPERIEQLAKCKNDAGKADTANCRNAIAAAAKADTESLFQRP